jgi:hypothetical protein
LVFFFVFFLFVDFLYLGMGITYQPMTPLVVGGGFGDFISGARCPDFLLNSTSDGKVS